MHYNNDIFSFQKYGMLKKKSDIDYTIANKINNLYKTAISKFNDIGLWLDYITFCKEVVSNKANRFSRFLLFHFVYTV